MKIIKVTPDIDYGVPYTVDNTNDTVDNTLITVDKTLDEIIQVNYLKILPSIITERYDVTFTNELTGTILNLDDCVSILENKIINIVLPSMELMEGNRYNVEVKTNNKIVWRGNVMSTDKNIQDYQQTTIQNNKIKF